MTTTHAPAATLELPDSDLVRRAATGDNGAFEELYRRHSQAAWRVAQAVTHNSHDAADAVSEAFTKVFQALPTGRLADGGAQFRPYLMAATRNAAIDGLRRQGKAVPSDSTLVLDAAETKSGPTERAIEALDASLVAQAFATLPERWRTILWLTEVEGMAPREAAGVLDLTPNGAAQLAVRAREGLRERYLQVHLTTGVRATCTATVGLLGAYVAGGLSARDVSKVDQHLVDCAECRSRVAELEELGTTLRRIALPFPMVLASLASGGAWAAKLGLAAASHGAAHAGASAGALHASAAAGGTSSPSTLARWVGNGSTETLRTLQRPLGVASVVLLSLGVIGAAIVNPVHRLHTSSGQRPTQIAAPPSPAAIDDALVQDQAVTFSLATNVGRRSGGGAQLTASPAPAPTAGPSGGPTSAPPKPKPPAAPDPLINADARAGDGDQTAAVAVGVGEGSCTGVQLGGTVVGCQPASQTKGSALTISTRGQLLGDNSISAP